VVVAPLRRAGNACRKKSELVQACILQVSLSSRSGGQATPAEKKANWFRLVFYKSTFRPAPAGSF